jgi:hypothetical protein
MKLAEFYEFFMLLVPIGMASPIIFLDLGLSFTYLSVVPSILILVGIFTIFYSFTKPDTNNTFFGIGTLALGWAIGSAYLNRGYFSINDFFWMFNNILGPFSGIIPQITEAFLAYPAFFILGGISLMIINKNIWK